MTGKGIRSERETVINFNEEDALATVWTASGVTYRRLLRRLGRAYLTEDGERHAVFTFPVKFITLPRVKVRKKPRSGVGVGSSATFGRRVARPPIE